MAQDKNEIAYKRKDAHLDLAKSDLAKAQITHPFDNVSLQHHALPDMAMDEIDVTKRFLSKRLDVPFFIGAMTGGTDRADAINACLVLSGSKFAILSWSWLQIAIIDNFR